MHIILGLTIALFLFVVALVTMDQGIIVPDYKHICESKNGVYLERTYQSGRYRQSHYTCVKKDTIIDMDEK